MQTVATTELTKTGAAMYQLISRGMLNPTEASHLVAEGLAKVDLLNIEVGTPKPEAFELIALTPEGEELAQQLEQRLAPIAGLCGALDVLGSSPSSRDQWVFTRKCFWDRLLDLKNSVAANWHSDDPVETSPGLTLPEYIPHVVKRTKVTKREKLSLEPFLAELRAIDPDFDKKDPTDEP
ncbi:hypothetical protein [Loktanella sp. R86503]|uniref:hypothetical protein n=1 Tax=Loktanella sp. R86503 TaxID=3093847 RepID=UPI0036DD0B53